MKFKKPSWELSINQLQKLEYPYAFFNDIHFELEDMNKLIDVIFISEPLSDTKRDEHILIFEEYFRDKKTSTEISVDHSISQTTVTNILNQYKTKLNDIVKAMTILRKNLIDNNNSKNMQGIVQLCLNMICSMNPKDIDMNILGVDNLTTTAFRRNGIRSIYQVEEYVKNGGNILSLNHIGYILVRKFLLSANDYLSEETKSTIHKQYITYCRKYGLLENE